MNHIRFLRTARTICDDPTNLGFDYVVADTSGSAVNCKVCSALLMEHNKSAYEAELAGDYNDKQRRDTPEVRDVRLFILGTFTFTSAFWIGFFFVLRWLLGL